MGIYGVERGRIRNIQGPLLGSGKTMEVTELYMHILFRI